MALQWDGVQTSEMTFHSSAVKRSPSSAAALAQVLFAAVSEGEL
jgi:hypothetical protein